MMGHFGGSLYKFKPAGIITYSPSPYGGARAAVALRPFLSELGCLSASKLACFSMVGDIFNEDGTVKDEESRQLKQLPGMLDQVEWLATACLKQKEACVWWVPLNLSMSAVCGEQNTEHMLLLL
jgi:NAD(P)H-dependent FMN reductase